MKNYPKKIQLKKLQFLFKLFLYIKYLSIELSETSEHLILEYLISKTEEINSHLCFLSLNRQNINKNLLEKLQYMTNHHYSLDIFLGSLYLWC